MGADMQIYCDQSRAKTNKTDNNNMETGAKSTADEQQVLNHADPEQKDVQERFFNEQPKLRGQRMAACVLYMCVSQVMSCVVSFSDSRHSTHIKYNERESETHSCNCCPIHSTFHPRRLPLMRLAASNIHIV